MPSNLIKTPLNVDGEHGDRPLLAVTEAMIRERKFTGDVGDELEGEASVASFVAGRENPRSD